MIVVNKRNHIPTLKDIYIGRPSPLGNPFSNKHGTLAQFVTEDPIADYREYLLNKIKNKDEAIITALKQIKEDSILVCWCKPKPCHGDVIIEILLSRII